MNSYDIAVIGGDGTGPEVTAENIKVLDAAGQKFGFKLNYTDFDFGGDRYLRTNEVLPDSASDDLRNFPAVILGAIGHPDVAPGVLEKGILLRLRDRHNYVCGNSECKTLQNTCELFVNGTLQDNIARHFPALRCL